MSPQAPLTRAKHGSTRCVAAGVEEPVTADQGQGMNAHDEAARELVAAKERIYELNHRNADLAGADRLTGADIDEVLALAAELDAACEEFRRKFYPCRYEVFTALGSVVVASRSHRRSEIVYDAYRPRTVVLS